jgi:predicted transposase/invertase (TIGR01784 family)
MKYLDPKNDVIFKKIFGQHPNILRSFLNSMLPLPDGQEIVELEYLSSEMIPDTYLEKFTSVDVRCKDKSGRQFLVEMQMNWTTAFKQRVLFNASKAYVTQTEKGYEYKNLQPVYALNLINQNYLPDSPEYYHHYAVVHLKDNNEKLEGLEFVFIELQKFKARNIRDKKMQVLWLRFLTEINEQAEHISEELTENPEIEQAIQFVYEASLSKEEKLLYDKNWDRISSEKTLLSAAKEEGIEIGVEKGIEIGVVKGIEIGKLEERQKMALAVRDMGMPIADIIKLTGLTEEEIKDL